MKVVIPGGENVSLAILRSLGKKGIDTTVVSTDHDSMVFYSKYCKNKVICKEFNYSLFSKFNENYIVMPVNDDLVLKLSRYRGLKCRLPFPKYNVIRNILYKDRFLHSCLERGIPAPKTIVFTKEDYKKNEKKDELTEMKFPLVLKPRRGSGSIGLFYINSKEGLEKNLPYALKKFGSVIIQEKIPYEEKFGVAVLANYESEIRRICVIKHHREYPCTGGSGAFVETVKMPQLVRYTSKIVKSLDYYGIALAEFVIDKRSGEPKIMEINPRFWNSLQPMISAGVDFPYLLYRMVIDGDIEKNFEYRTGIRCRHIIFDTRSMMQVLRGNLEDDDRNLNKARRFINFIKFYESRCYYILSIDDPLPFLSVLLGTAKRKVKKFTAKIAPWL